MYECSLQSRLCASAVGHSQHDQPTRRFSEGVPTVFAVIVLSALLVGSASIFFDISLSL